MEDLPTTFTSALSDRYTVQRELGRGGMATVYLARDLKHRRQVAIKVLRQDLAATLGADRFLQEIEIAAGLTHPHVLALYDSGQCEGVLYYVMPYVAGESLRGILVREGRMALDRARRITTEVAGALTYAHRNGVVHRDIKPENILLSDGHAVVADFGIAKAISTAGDARLTRTGFPIGTPGYMSPEQAAGNTDLDPRTDVFSLACVTYEMLVGAPPGMWVSREAEELGRLVDASPQHRERLDLLPGSLEQALVRAMAMRPDDRFRTPTEFAEAIDASPGGARRYSGREANEIVRRAAEIQAAQPTSAPMSLGGVAQIAAEVGIPPEHVREAASALDRPAQPGAPERGGLFGIRPDISLESTVDGEIVERNYEALLEEIRHSVGEVGRINETLGRSLSWNSLSLQNTVESTGRLLHVMVRPKDGRTTIRITESAGQLPVILTASCALVTIAGASLGGDALGGLGGYAVSAVAALGASYTGARAFYRRYINRRFRKLRELMDRLTRHTMDAADATTTPNAER